jgi:methionine-gamma-lyase
MAKTGSSSGSLHESTVAVHGGEFVDPATRASSPNLVMSATFAPTDVTGFSARDEKDYDGFVYGRVSSPTVRQLEHKLAALEGAESALAFGSGVAASHALIAGRLSKGDHLLMPDSNYVGVAELVRDTLPRFGIETSFVDTLDAKAVAAGIRPNTRMLWRNSCQSTMQVCDIKTWQRPMKGRRDVVVDSTAPHCQV